MPLSFPYRILKARSVKLDLVGNVISGGITADGYQQRVNTSGGGLWRLDLGFNRFSKPDQIRAWRSVQYGSDGGVMPVNIPICDVRQSPGGGSGGGGGVPHSDGSPFSDLSLYESSLSYGVAGAVTAGSTTVRMTFENGEEPMGGELFSMPYGEGQHELHAVIGVEGVGPGVFDLKVRPPFRAAHDAGEIAEFGHPIMTGVLVASDSMSLTVDFGRWGNGQAAFIEYLA